MKPKMLYHGSPTKIDGEIVPSRAIDINNNSIENNLFAVYASSDRDTAIRRAIEKNNFKNGENVKKQSEIFLYTIPSETFEQSTYNNKQYFSFISIIPFKVETIDVIHYLNKREFNNWEHIIEYPNFLLDKLLLGFSASPF